MFDKRAYNRDYYRRNKEKWEEYRDSSGKNARPARPFDSAGRTNPNYIPPSIRDVRAQRYGEYGRNKASAEAKKRATSGMNSRYGEYGKAKAAEMAKKRTTSNMNDRYSWKNYGFGMAQEEVRKKAKDIQDAHKRKKNTDAYRRVLEDVANHRRESRQSEYAKNKAQEEARKQRADKKATKIRTVKTAAKKAANAYKKAMKMLFG